MSNQHNIQLRGPWQVTAFAEDAVPVFEDRINVREIADWSLWFSEVTNPESVKSVSYQRKFNWPAPEPKPSSVNLIVTGASPKKVELNGEAIELAFSMRVGLANVLSCLLASNRLLIEYDLVDLAVSSIYSGLVEASPSAVHLQISE